MQLADKMQHAYDAYRLTYLRIFIIIIKAKKKMQPLTPEARAACLRVINLVSLALSIVVIYLACTHIQIFRHLCE